MADEQEPLSHIKPTGKQVAEFGLVLTDESDAVKDMTNEQWAKHVLEKAFQIYESRAQYVVAGQVFDHMGRRVWEKGEAVKVALNAYDTVGNAKKAAETLVGSTSSGYMLRTWVIPIHRGTPADYHKYLKQKTEAGGQEVESVQAIVDSEMTRQSLNWCRAIELDEESFQLMECRREKDHPGVHGNLSPDLGGIYETKGDRE